MHRFSVYEKIRRLLHSEVAERKGSMELRLLLLNLDPRRKFNRSYTLGERIGVGAFGAVYRCTSKLTGEERALKMMCKNRPEADKADNAVVNEIEVMIRLDHPNVAKFYEFFEDRRYIYLVEELCLDGDLSSKLRDDISKTSVRQLYRDVMLGVAYCHALNIAHRDLKFENCILKVEDRCVAKVIDFGLSAIRKGDEADEWLNEVLGTLYYAAPEVLDKSKLYGVKCDCWSFGVMVYVHLTQEHPLFKNKGKRMSSKQLVECIKSEEVRWHLLDDQNNEEAADFVKKLLLRDVSKRASAQEVLREPWLQIEQTQRHADRKETMKMLKRLTTFRAMSEFDKVIFMMTCHLEPQKFRTEQTRMFLNMDKSPDGFITETELGDVLEAAGVEVDEARVKDAIDAVDTSADGKLSQNEWLSATMDKAFIESADAIKGLFAYFDADGSGFVSSDEIRRVVTEQEAAEVLKSADKSMDGVLDFEEFSQLIKNIVLRRYQHEDLEAAGDEPP